MRAVVTCVVFVNAFLLFLVEPMVARILLPAFGGAPSVWTASMLFFQLALLAGYGYANYARKLLPPKAQIGVHLGLLAVGLVTMPISLPSGAGTSGSANPTFALLLALARMIGPAFVVLSAGSTILQQWFAQTDDTRSHDPYFLYAASNVGSLLALLAYPFIVEPLLGLHAQALIYRSAYIFLWVIFAFAAVITHLRPSRSSAAIETKEDGSPAPTIDEGTVAGEMDPRRAPADATPGKPWQWVMLGAIPSSLMLGATNYISSNVAPVPLLWVAPLALYLLSFILAFSRNRIVKTKPLSRYFPLIAVPATIAIVMEATHPMLLMASINLAAFFWAAWMCHSRLADLRPDARRLGEFYFCMALGGVIGGLFNSVVAPSIFVTYAEYPLALVAACAMRMPFDPSKINRRKDALWPVLVSFVTIAIVLGARAFHLEAGPNRTALMVGVPCILAFFAVDSPIRFSLSIGAVFFWANMLHTSSDARIIHTERSFFGVHRVVEYGTFHRLVHGNTIHGLQDSESPQTPLTYYHPSGPIGTVFRAFSDRTDLKAALVGLGSGSLAAYGKPGWKFTYYEIDPVVVRIAQDPALFTYYHDSQAEMSIVLGDARLTMAKSPGNYDVIALDAFSSDSIPVHLLTREAFEMYMQKLAPHGMLAVHISNRYLHLAPVVAAICHDLHLFAAEFEDGVTIDEGAAGKYQSHWILVGRKEADVAPAMQVDRSWNGLESDGKTRAWTDDYSNLVQSFSTD